MNLLFKRRLSWWDFGWIMVATVLARSDEIVAALALVVVTAFISAVGEIYLENRQSC